MDSTRSHAFDGLQLFFTLIILHLMSSLFDNVRLVLSDFISFCNKAYGRATAPLWTSFVQPYKDGVQHSPLSFSVMVALWHHQIVRFFAILTFLLTFNGYEKNISTVPYTDNVFFPPFWHLCLADRGVKYLYWKMQLICIPLSSKDFSNLSGTFLLLARIIVISLLRLGAMMIVALHDQTLIILWQIFISFLLQYFHFYLRTVCVNKLDNLSSCYVSELKGLNRIEKYLHLVIFLLYVREQENSFTKPNWTSRKKIFPNTITMRGVIYIQNNRSLLPICLCFHIGVLYWF